MKQKLGHAMRTLTFKAKACGKILRRSETVTLTALPCKELLSLQFYKIPFCGLFYNADHEIIKH
jgi:hypothetical protein